jgi:hypothetical protein
MLAVMLFILLACIYFVSAVVIFIQSIIYGNSVSESLLDGIFTPIMFAMFGLSKVIIVIGNVFERNN